MQMPEWTKPALMGAGTGAIAMAIVGFSWGGWVTAGRASEMSEKQSTAAVVSALTPYCVQKSVNDPNAAAVLSELAKASSYNRRGIIEETGWATVLGTDQPDKALAEACQIELMGKI